MVQNVSGESLADTEGGDTEEDDDKFDSGFKRIEAAFSVWVEILESFFSRLILSLLSVPNSFFHSLISFLTALSASIFFVAESFYSF